MLDLEKLTVLNYQLKVKVNNGTAFQKHVIYLMGFYYKKESTVFK